MYSENNIIAPDGHCLTEFDEAGPQFREQDPELDCVFLLQSLVGGNLSPDEVLPDQKFGEVGDESVEDLNGASEHLPRPVVPILLDEQRVVILGQALLLESK